MARPGASRSTTASSSDTLQSITVDTDSAGAYSTNTTASTSTIDTIGECRTLSGRVKRVAGLKEGRMLEGELTPDTNCRTVSGETLVERAGGSQSSLLQQGLAALSLPWSMSSFFKSTEEPVIRQATEASQSSASIQESGTPRSALMKERADRVKAKREKEERERAERAQKDNEKATRRSSRLDLVEKATQVVDVATSVLGKRSRDVLEKGKGKLGELKRRPILRPRHGTKSVPPGFEGPPAKRLRLEDSNSSETAEATKAVARKPTSRPRTKRWLSQGLYVGQNRNFDPRLTDAKNKARLAGKTEPNERKFLPLPMFSGQRLLEHGRDFKLPYDIFSPLPPGQPKPDEWKKTNKNVFVGDAGSIWRNIKLQEYSTCVCLPETGCDEDCQNRFMFYECDSSNCRLDAETCGNRSFDGLKQRTKAGGKYNVGVEVIKTVDRGYGVRSNRTFDPNQIIVEYTGEIITQEDCEDRMHTLYKDNECYYLMLFDQNMIIDATRGSIARFVNHSCEPNCRMEKWTVAGKPRMALFAGDKGIMTGDELTYDYNFDPFSQKNVQECRCGSPSCRGVLGPKPKEQPKPKEPKDAKPSGLSAAKRKLHQVLDESTSKLNKKRKTIGAISVKAKYESAKVRTTKKLIKARAYSSTTAGKERLVKKASSRSIASAKISVPRSSAAKRLTNAIKKRGSVRMVRTASSSSSRVSLVGNKPARPPSRRESVKTAASTARKNVVKTVRGATGGRSRTIRSISAGATE